MQTKDFKTISGIGKVMCRISSSQTGGAYSLFEVEVTAGAGSQIHIQHREDECLYILDGDFRVLSGDKDLATHRGELIYISKGTLHRYTNVGDTTGKLLVLYTPGRSHEELLHELETSRNTGAEILQTFARYGVEIIQPQ